MCFGIKLRRPIFLSLQVGGTRWVETLPRDKAAGGDGRQAKHGENDITVKTCAAYRGNKGDREVSYERAQGGTDAAICVGVFA